MAEQSFNPLSEIHLQSLNRLLAECARTRDYLAKCEGCGLDVEEEKAKNAQTIAIGERIKKQFFPNES